MVKSIAEMKDTALCGDGQATNPNGFSYKVKRNNINGDYLLEPEKASSCLSTKLFARRELEPEDFVATSTVQTSTFSGTTSARETHCHTLNGTPT